MYIAAVFDILEHCEDVEKLKRGEKFNKIALQIIFFRDSLAASFR